MRGFLIVGLLIFSQMTWAEFGRAFCSHAILGEAEGPNSSNDLLAPSNIQNHLFRYFLIESGVDLGLFQLPEAAEFFVQGGAEYQVPLDGVIRVFQTLNEMKVYQGVTPFRRLPIQYSVREGREAVLEISNLNQRNGQYYLELILTRFFPTESRPNSNRDVLREIYSDILEAKGKLASETLVFNSDPGYGGRERIFNQNGYQQVEARFEIRIESPYSSYGQLVDRERLEALSFQLLEDLSHLPGAKGYGGNYSDLANELSSSQLNYLKSQPARLVSWLHSNKGLQFNEAVRFSNVLRDRGVPAWGEILREFEAEKKQRQIEARANINGK